MGGEKWLWMQDEWVVEWYVCFGLNGCVVETGLGWIVVRFRRLDEVYDVSDTCRYFAEKNY